MFPPHRRSVKMDATPDSPAEGRTPHDERCRTDARPAPGEPPVSPRRADPDLGANLLQAAARLLAEQGPSALTTRRLAAAVGTSTMAVYTRFSGMDDLVRALVHEGFRHLAERMRAVGASADPVADVAELGIAYRENALEHSHLYAVMFGGATLVGFPPPGEGRRPRPHTPALPG